MGATPQGVTKESYRVTQGKRSHRGKRNRVHYIINSKSSSHHYLLVSLNVVPSHIKTTGTALGTPHNGSSYSPAILPSFTPTHTNGIIVSIKALNSVIYLVGKVVRDFPKRPHQIRGKKKRGQKGKEGTQGGGEERETSELNTVTGSRWLGRCERRII